MIEKMRAMNGTPCPCGREHRLSVELISGRGVLQTLPEILTERSIRRPFLISDLNTWQAAGRKVATLLDGAEISYVNYTFPQATPEPDETSVGAAVMHYDSCCDGIVAVGSGVINDIGKILSALSGKPYIIVATAPSMDGYASATSSMTRAGLKISLPSRSADVILGDTDILCSAPMELMKSGLGDMLAKYVSICEWRIAHLITGEYYCEEVADLIRGALRRCVENADGLLRRDPGAVEAVFEGLVIGGVAMNYAGVSRPASGVEHYISHVLDMRGAEFGIPVRPHGIQCAVGTLIAIRLYEQVKALQPNRQKALGFVAAFDKDSWHRTLQEFLGKGAESMIALEKAEGKYDPAAHRLRLERILGCWPEIRKIMEEELPSAERIEALLRSIEAPTTLREIGVDEALLPKIFAATRDIRDKYVLSRLVWDLGLWQELKF